MKRQLVTLVLAGLLGSAVQADELPGLVARFHFDGDALDSSGLANHADVQGATFVGDAYDGQSLLFDGSNDYVRVPHSDDLYTPTFSVTAWIKSTATNPPLHRAAFGKHREHDNSSYFWFVHFETNLAATMVGSVYNDFQDILYPIAYATNEWTMVALTYDAAAMHLYIDGVHVGDQSVAGHNGNEYDLLIGAGEWGFFTDTPQRWWKGNIDEVCVFDRALTSNEVYNLFATESNAVYAGSVSCHLEPVGAVDAGAGWRLSTDEVGLWRPSGSVVTNLLPNSYQIVFKSLTNWVSPSPLLVTVESLAHTAATATYQQVDTDGLLIHYDFNSFVNGYVPNTRDNVYSGQVYGASIQAGGVSGNYALFDGINDYIRIPNGTELDALAFTASAWVKSDDASPSLHRGVFGKHREHNNISYYWLHQYLTNFAGTMIGGQYNQYRDVTGDSAAGVGQWGMLTLTFDQTNLQLYINGVRVDTEQNVSGYAGNDYDMLLGAGEWASSGSTPQRWWKGCIDEFRFYDRALSSNAIFELYSTGSNALPSVGSVRCDLSPVGAVSAGAAWRLDSEPEGVWHSSGYILSNVVVGSYDIELKPLLSWVTPDPVAIVVSSGAETYESITYEYASTNDLVLYFDFDAPSAGTVDDKSGYGNHGSAFNVVYQSNGYLDGCFYFNGTSSYVTIPDDPSYDTTTFTISAWAKSDRTNAAIHAGIMGKHKEHHNVSYYWMHQYITNLAVTMIGTHAGQFRDVTSPGAAIIEQWGLTTVTYDGLRARLYVNGALIGTEFVTNYSGNAYDLLVGAGEWKFNLAEPQRWWKGCLDEVRIYRRALTSNEVFDLSTTNVPFDVIAPMITEVLPADGYITRRAQVPVRVAAEDNVAVTGVVVEGAIAHELGNGYWLSHPVPLSFGSNILDIAAYDEQGNTATASVTYVRARRLRVHAHSDGVWTVLNDNDFDLDFDWQVEGSTEGGARSISPEASDSFNSSTGPKTLGVLIADELHDRETWNPSPDIQFETPGGDGPKAGPKAGADTEVMTWRTSSGQTYTVYFSSNLLEESWTAVPGAAFVGDGGTLSFTNDPSAHGNGFYRVDVGNVITNQ